jgi:hypothetical protein
MNGRNMNVNINNEAFMYMEALVRKHFSAIMTDYNLPMPPARIIDDVQRPYLLQILAAGLEQDCDVGLSYLLRAAINVREDVSEETAERINHFLQVFADTMMGVTATAGRALLQTVFEALVRREEFGNDPSSSERSFSEESLSGLTVHITNKIIEVPFQDILPCFWNRELETVCHVCHQPFVEEPPIRTFAKHELMVSSTSHLHVQVFNRHFSCLQQSGVFFVPVSHVWDDSIRRANANELKTHDDEAAGTLVSTLKALLKGAEDAYEPGVEFWHDYLSVPQWQTQTKESLLIYLPAIYHQAEEILVHMADLPPGQISHLLIGNLLGAETSMIESFKRIPLLHALCEAQWMQRMWVTLEYSQSRAACIMDRSSNIRRSPVGTGPFARDTFSHLISGAHYQLLGLFRYAKSFAKTLSLPGEFLGGIAAGERGTRQLCLGEAMELVARKQCQVFRDRFLAIYVLMNRHTSPCDSPPIPRPEDEACRWVWRNALCKGDYSALLLQPRECTPSSNPGPDCPSWLVGHQSLEGAEWDVGNQISASERPLVIEGEAVKGLLDLVGEIEKVHYLEVEESGEVDGVEKIIGILSMIARREATRLSPQSLYEGLIRVFPFDNNHKKMAWALERMVFSLEESQENDHEFTAKLQRQLEVFDASHETWRDRRREAAEEISRILEMEKHIAGNISSQVTRLTRSRHIARHRNARGAEGGEPICEVRCPDCRTVTLFRLDLRGNGRIGDRVYRIPGLGYSNSVENGVGLVMNNGRITGRMLYGPPACGCRLIEAVDIR